MLTVPVKRLTPDHRALLELRDAPVPTLRREWAIWAALASRRRSGMGGAEAIGFDQIVAWQACTGRQLAPWQLTALDAIEAAWRKVISEAD